MKYDWVFPLILATILFTGFGMLPYGCGDSHGREIQLGIDARESLNPTPGADWIKAQIQARAEIEKEKVK